MTIYLDLSALNRIFDNQTQARIYLESAAMLVIIRMIEDETFILTSSSAVNFEHSRNPYEERRAMITSVLTHAQRFQELTSEVVSRAEKLERQGIKALDALHPASAETMRVDAFITCDDKLLKSAAPQVKVVSPIQLVVELMQQGEINGSFR